MLPRRPKRKHRRVVIPVHLLRRLIACIRMLLRPLLALKRDSPAHPAPRPACTPFAGMLHRSQVLMRRPDGSRASFRCSTFPTFCATLFKFPGYMPDTAPVHSAAFPPPAETYPHTHRTFGTDSLSLLIVIVHQPRMQKVMRRLHYCWSAATSASPSASPHLPPAYRGQFPACSPAFQLPRNYLPIPDLFRPDQRDRIALALVAPQSKHRRIVGPSSPSFFASRLLLFLIRRIRIALVIQPYLVRHLVTQTSSYTPASSA